MNSSSKSWRFFLILGLLLIGGWFAAKWATERAGVALFHAMAPMMDSMAKAGVPITLIGEIPEAPRAAKLVVTRGSISGVANGDTVFGAEIRLAERLAADSAPAWGGRCLGESGQRTFRVELGEGRLHPEGDPSRTLAGMKIVAGGEELVTLHACAKAVE